MKLYHFSSVSLLPRQLKEGLQMEDAPSNPPLPFHGPLLFESSKGPQDVSYEVRLTVEIPPEEVDSLKWIKTDAGPAYVYVGEDGVISEWIVQIEKKVRPNKYMRIGLQELTAILKSAAA